MTIRSRLYASLVVALAMMLAAGLGVAGPATAGPDGTDIAAADEAELGALLGVHYEPQPDGYIKIADYENATDVTAVAAACTMTTRAYKPTKSGSYLRGQGYFRLSGCGSSPFEVIISLEIYVNGYWVSRASYDYLAHPPTSGYPRVAVDCRRGTWTSSLLVQRGNNDQYTRSSTLNVSSC